jgi:hypothetical protein
MVQGEAGSAQERSSQEENSGSSPYIKYSIHPGSTKMYHDLRR